MTDVYPEALTRVCPRCSVQSQELGAYCPHCGSSYSGRTGRSKLAKWGAIGIAAAVLLGAGGVGISQKISHNATIKAEKTAAAKKVAAKATARKQAQAQAKAEAESAAAVVAAQKDEDDQARTERHDMVNALEGSIRKDAKKRVTEGTLIGPIFSAGCTPLGGGSADDLTALTGTFECLAINEKHKDGTREGYVFSATINWNDGSYTWHLGR
jgi:hypothetical protein